MAPLRRPRPPAPLLCASRLLAAAAPRSRRRRIHRDQRQHDDVRVGADIDPEPQRMDDEDPVVAHHRRRRPHRGRLSARAHDDGRDGGRLLRGRRGPVARHPRIGLATEPQPAPCVPHGHVRGGGGLRAHGRDDRRLPGQWRHHSVRVRPPAERPHGAERPWVGITDDRRDPDDAAAHGAPHPDAELAPVARPRPAGRRPGRARHRSRLGCSMDRGARRPRVLDRKPPRRGARDTRGVRAAEVAGSCRRATHDRGVHLVRGRAVPSSRGFRSPDRSDRSSPRSR